jgi:hypothetical protein
MSESQ